MESGHLLSTSLFVDLPTRLFFLRQAAFCTGWSRTPRALLADCSCYKTASRGKMAEEQRLDLAMGVTLADGPAGPGPAGAACYSNRPRPPPRLQQRTANWRVWPNRCAMAHSSKFSSFSSSKLAWQPHRTRFGHEASSGNPIRCFSVETRERFLK